MGDFVSQNIKNKSQQLSIFEGNQEENNQIRLNENNLKKNFVLYSVESGLNDLK